MAISLKSMISDYEGSFKDAEKESRMWTLNIYLIVRTYVFYLFFRQNILFLYLQEFWLLTKPLVIHAEQQQRF